MDLPAGYAELKSRLLFVLLGILVYRLGAHIPVPGLDPERIASFFAGKQMTLFGLFNMFSGGALSHVTVFAIGIVPYITASIMMQLLTLMLPAFEQLKKEGESGRKKINQYTRYLTLVIACIHSIGIARWLSGEHIALYSGFYFYFTCIVTLVTGTMFLMWLGEQMTEKGIGNGISILIFSGIVSSIPSALNSVFEQVREGQMQPLVLLIILGVVCGVTAFVVFVERAQRKLRVNYAQRTQGRKVFAAQTSHLPLKINMAGVIPPIFASTLIFMPATLAQLVPSTNYFAWLASLSLALTPGHALYLLVYATGIIFFSFFYTSLVFNPKDTADNLKKSSAYIPGIRPGEQTAYFIEQVMTRLTLAASGYLVVVCLIPQLMMSAWNVPFYFGGTSLLIIVVVIMDFVTQIQAHLMTQQYDSLMRKANLKGPKRSALLY